MHQYNVHWNNTALTAATAKTVCQLVTGSTRKLKILAFGIGYDGVTNNSEPTDIRWLTQTTAGTMSSFTPTAVDQSDPAAIFTAQYNATAEPTAGTDLLWIPPVHPQGGMWVFQYPQGLEPTLAVSTRWGLKITAADAVNCSGFVMVQE